ncbi:MAG: hypothetical protein PSN34_15780 [Urechidicola sp.]|nr:hypothetical protein [Urechidicola sp.]
METTTNSSFESFENTSLSINSISFLKETGKWAKFLSIVGFVMIGLMIIAALFVSAMPNSMPGFDNSLMSSSSLIGGIYLLMSAIYFFPVYYLFQFSNKINKAFKQNDNHLLEDSFKNLKSHYKFIGVFTLIFILFYVVIIFIAIFAGIAESF